MKAKAAIDILEGLDFFGQKVEFNINGKKSTQTVIGGFLGIVVIGMIIGAAWTLGKDIIYHEQPALVVQDLVEPKRAPLTLDAYTFPISIVIQEIPSNAVYFNPRYFKMAVELREVDNGKGTMNTTSYELEKCENRHFPTVLNETFYSSGINNYMCIKNQNITISGYWDEPKMSFIMIRLLYCHDDPNCASKEEIDKFLMKSKWTWNIYCLNSLIDTSNYENPTQFYILNLYRMTQVYVSKVHEVYLQTLSSFTDMGMIFEEFKESTSIAFDYEKSDSTNEVSDKSLYDFYVFPSNKKTIYRRRYVKAQTLAANLGGIVKFLMTIASIFTFVFNSHKLYCILINNNIDVYRKLNNLENLYKSPPNSLRIKNTVKSSDLVNCKSPEYSLNRSLPKNTQIKSPFTKVESKSLRKNSAKKMILNFSFDEILKKYLCSSKVSNKKKIYEDCKPIMDEELNILNILSKLDDVQKLKIALFDKEQLTLFSGMGKIEYGLEGSEMSKMRKVIKNIKNSLKSRISEYKYTYLAQEDMEKESLNSRLVKYLSREFY